MIPLAILAGGASERFGSDKALTPVHGEPLLTRMLRIAGPRPVAVIGRTALPAGSPPAVCLPDPTGLPTRSGPLAGISAALAWNADVLVLPCDLPMLDAAAFAWLDALPGSGDAAVAVLDGRRNPLIGRWRCPGVVMTAVAAGVRSPRQVLELASGVQAIPPPAHVADALRSANDPSGMAALIATQDAAAR